MMNSYDKVKAIREQVAQWGYNQMNVIVAHADGVIYIGEDIIKKHPDFPQTFGLKENTSDRFFQNGRLQTMGQVKLAYYL